MSRAPRIIIEQGGKRTVYRVDKIVEVEMNTGRMAYYGMGNPIAMFVNGKTELTIKALGVKSKKI